METCVSDPGSLGVPGTREGAGMPGGRHKCTGDRDKDDPALCC